MADEAAENAAILQLHVGDLVSITGIEKPGHIAFLGPITGKPGKWVGVVLDYPGGKNDGTVGGAKYFDAKPNHGLFAKPKMIKVLESAEKAGKTAPPPKSPAAAAAATADSKKAPPPPTAATATTAPPKTPAKPKEPEKPVVKPEMKTPAKVEAPKPAEVKSTPKPEPAPKKEEPKPTPSKAAPAATASDASGAGAAGGLRGKITELEKQLADANGIINEMQKQLAQKESGGGSSGAMYDLNATQEKKLLAEIETLTHANEGLRNELKKTKEKNTELEGYRPYKQKCADLDAEVQKLKKQKNSDAEKIETLQLEWDTCKEELALAQDDLKYAQEQTAADLQAMIAQLPTGHAEVAQLTETNRQLTDLLKKTGMTLQATNSKYDSLKAETDAELEELRAKAILVDKLEEDLANMKEALDEMRTIADGNSNLEALVEKLSEKNTELVHQQTDAKTQIRNLRDLIEANNDVIDSHVELETQLQSELESKTMELQEAHRQLKIKQSQLEDLNNINRSFKNLVKDLENMNQDLAAAQAMSQEEKVSFRKGRQNNIKMLSQMSEARHRAIEQLRSNLEAKEHAMSFAFLRAYIPDNVAVEEGGLQLQIKAERLLLLATNGARILHELFGAGSGKGDRLASHVYGICEKLVTFALACNKLRFCIRVAEAKQYDSMVAERDTLDSPTREVEALLDLAAKDEISYDTPIDGLIVAHDNVQGFVQSNFVEDEDDHSEVATLVRRGPPRIHLEVQRLLFQQSAAVSKLESIADLLSGYVAAEGEGEPVFQRVFEQMEALQQSNKELAAKILTQSLTFEIVVGNSKTHDPNMFKEELEMCARFSRGGILRLKELLDWVDGFLVKPSDLGAQDSAEEAAKKKKAAIASLDTRFETEMKEGRLIAELQSIRTTLEGLHKRIEHADTKAGDVLARPVWETRALEVRQELMQAASLKVTLEEATKRTEAKTRELFAAKKLARDNQAMVEVLTSKITMLQTKTNEVDDLMNEVELLRKRDKEYEASSAVQEKEREKYTTANAALRTKNLKLKYELKRLQDVRSAPTAGGTPGHSGKMTSLQGASEEVNMLTRTITMQRQQISSLRASLGAQDLKTVLPPLPVINSVAIHAKAQRTETENKGAESQLQASNSPFALPGERVELHKVLALKQDLSLLTARARNARAAPILVDLSKKESLSQQWYTSQSQASTLAKDAVALETKFSEFLSSKQSEVFRSLCGTIPVMGSSVPGAKSVTVGPNDKLVGKVTVPVALSEQLSCKVLMRPSQLQQLHSALVI